MSLATIHRNPDIRTLRQFGWITAVVLPATVWWWGCERPTIAASAIVGVAVAAVAVAWPRKLRRPFVALSLITAPIGMIAGELLVAGVYYGVLTPIGLVFKLLRRDALRRSFDPKATTYWQPLSKRRATADYFRQY